jgi:PAS domain S-box-containing protein
MEEKLRKSGIDVIGDISWGTHLCLFYQTKDDLVEVLVSYFKTGIENNEFCMWVCWNPLRMEEAKDVLKKRLNNLNDYIAKGQIEIADFSRHQTEREDSGFAKMKQFWIDKERLALERGFAGLRLAGNTYWLEKRRWKDFKRYEEGVDDIIKSHRMLVICPYSLDKCKPSEMIDIVGTHKSALIKHEGKWEIIESAKCKKTEEAIRQSEAKLRTLVEHIPMKIFVKDTNSVYLSCNKNYAEDLKISPEEIKDKTDYDFFPKELAEKYRRDDKRIIKTGTTEDIKEKYFEQGEGRWIHTVKTPYKDEKGNIIGVLGIFRDITESKKLEEEKEELLKAIEIAKEAVNITDSIGYIIYTNSAMNKLFGYKKGELIGKYASILNAGPQPETVIKKIMNAIEKEGVWEGEIQNKRKDGIEFISYARISAVKDTDGKIINFISTQHDITERKKTEEALRESEEKHRSLVERANYGIGIIQDKIIKYVNPHGPEIFGYTVQEIIGTPFTDYIHSDEVNRVLSYYTRRMKGERVPSKYETAIRNREGQKIAVEFNASVISYQGKAADMVIFRDITEGKKAEEALREKEAFNFALFQYNPVRTMVVDRQGKVVKVNTAKRMSGDRLPNIGDVMYKDYARNHEIDMHAELTECLKSGKTKSFPELKYGDKFLSITIAPFPQGAIITSQDITERKRAEKALHQSEKRFKELWDNAPVAYHTLDARGIITSVNQTECKMFQYSSEEMVGRSIFDFILPEQQEEARRRFEQKISGRRVPRFVNRIYVKKDGSKIYVVVDDILERDSKGKIIGVKSAVVDITERRKAEEALSESEEKYRTLTDNVNVAVFRNRPGPKGRFIEVNPAMVKMFDYKSKKEFLKLNVSDLYQNQGDIKKFSRKMLRDGFVKNEELKLKKKDGTPIVCSESTVVVKDEKGRARYFDGIIEDITERKRVEEDLRESKEQMRNLAAHLQSVREQERTFIAREIHDELGQSLTALKMDLFWLKNRTPADQKPLFEKTEQMTQLVDTTIQGVKKLSSELRPRLLDDLGLLAAIEWQGEEFERHAGIKCEMTIDAQNMELDQDFSTAVFRIFQEALTNVARHADATKVKVGLREKAGRLELKVRDNGKGIPEGKISDPKSFGIVGMKERVYFLGGKIEIKGVQDKGTIIKMIIPLPKRGVTK